MINLELGVKEYTVTLNERIDIDNPVILLLLTYTQGETFEKLLKVVDNSASGDRANDIQFEIVNTEAAEDLANGKVHLLPGDYNYKFYQSPDAVLDITGKKFLEKGLARYDVPQNIEKEYDDTPEEKFYNG